MSNNLEWGGRRYALCGDSCCTIWVYKVGKTRKTRKYNYECPTCYKKYNKRSIVKYTW